MAVCAFGVHSQITRGSNKTSASRASEARKKKKQSGREPGITILLPHMMSEDAS